MKKKIKSMVLFLFFTILCFYLLPFLAFRLGGFFIFSLIVIPPVTFAFAAMYSVINGFNPFYSIIAGLTFIPVPILFFNISTQLSVKLSCVILALALLGNILGFLICMLINRICKIPKKTAKKMG